MIKPLSSAVCAAALLLSGASLVAMAPPAQAAVSFQFGFNFFQDRLAPYGRWIHHPLWGDVWRPRPRLVGRDFQPYTNGYWELTDEYGWYWVSEDPFDDVVYHYGRWVYDPQWSWLWVPGYTWAPAWVSWREGEDYTGWMPLPPDEAFLSGTGLSFGVNLGSIGIDFYRRWYEGRVDPDRFYVFVDNRHLVERDYRRFRVPTERVVTIINRTRPVTRYEVVNNRVVNRGVDVRVIERATGRRIAPVSAKVVIKPNAVITTVDEAKKVRERERAQHPIEAEHRGAGEGPGPGKEKGSAAEPNANGGGTPAEDKEGRNRNRENNAGNAETGAGANTEHGNPATEETGKKKAGKQTETTGNSTEEGNPVTGETGKKKAGKKATTENPETGNSTMSPNPNGAGAAPNESTETPSSGTPKRHKTSGEMNGPAADETGAGSSAGGNAGTNESGTPPPHRRNSGSSGNMGSMNGANPGPGNAQTGGMSRSNGPNASPTSSGENVPANSAEQPKKKKKPKNPDEQPSDTPE